MRRFAIALALLAGCAPSDKAPEEPTPANQATEEGGDMDDTAAPAQQAVPDEPASPPTSPGGPDRDGDGVVDDMDKCPDEPEDRDGFEDDDGCPDPDNDHDGILDIDDRCPADPESKNGRQDEDGCPD